MIPCPICHCIFKKKKTKQKFCSEKCSLCNARSFVKPKKKSGKNIKCVFCGVNFLVPLWRIKKFNVKYCSKICMGKDILPRFSKIYGFKKGFFCGRKKEGSKSIKPGHKYVRLYVNGVRTYEHRHIVEAFIGRKLLSSEDIHHINGNPKDNRIDNLQILSRSEHMVLENKIRYSKSIT